MPTADRFAAWVRAADSAMLAVTADSGGELDACLVGFHSQSSIEPLRYVVWLSRANRTYLLARRAGVLGVHLLGVAQRPLAERLGAVTADDDPAKLAGLRRRRHRTGAVLLGGCPAWFAGRVVGRLGGGDHQGFTLEPLAAGPGLRGEPLRLADTAGIDAGHPATDGRR